MKKIKYFLTAFLMVLFFVPKTTVFAIGQFTSGNILIVSNTTTPSAGWGDPIFANVGDNIEFKLTLTNSGDQPVNNVVVKAGFPVNVSGNSLVTSIQASGDSGVNVSDTATVNVPTSVTAKNLVYLPGHAVMTSPSGSTPLPDTVGTTGVTVGTVQPGSVSFIEVIFQATVTENPTPTPTGAPIPTATPTPAPTTTPNPTPTGTLAPTPTPTLIITPTPTPAMPIVQCPAGFTLGDVSQQGSVFIVTCNSNNNSTGPITITVNGGSASATTGSQTQTQTVSQSSAPAVLGASTAVPTVSSLPKTGLPLEVWGLSSLLPLGFGLRKFAKGKKVFEDNGYSIWQKEELDQEN